MELCYFTAFAKETVQADQADQAERTVRGLARAENLVLFPASGGGLGSFCTRAAARLLTRTPLNGGPPW